VFIVRRLGELADVADSSGDCAATSDNRRPGDIICYALSRRPSIPLTMQTKIVAPRAASLKIFLLTVAVLSQVSF